MQTIYRVYCSDSEYDGYVDVGYYASLEKAEAAADALGSLYSVDFYVSQVTYDPV